MVRASIVHVQDQRQRQTLRRQLGSLNLNLVKRITVARYAEHFNRFAQHLQDTNQPWPNSPEEFDLVVSEYLEILWDLGIPKTSATYTLASIHYYMPQLKRKLPRSWQLQAVSDKLELPCQAVPLDIDTLFAFVGYFWKIGHRAMSLVCLVAFNGLLRTGELLELRISDCIEASDSWVLQLRSTKSRPTTSSSRRIRDYKRPLDHGSPSKLITRKNTRRFPGRDFTSSISARMESNEAFLWAVSSKVSPLQFTKRGSHMVFPSYWKFFAHNGAWQMATFENLQTLCC